MTSRVYNTYDLDLDELEHTEDPAKITQMFQELIIADSDFKIYPARTWVENFLYFNGVSDFSSKLQNGTVTNLQLNSSTNGRGRGALPRRRIPKTFKACQIQAQNITRQRPNIKVYEDSDDEAAVKSAKLSNLLLDYLWRFDCEDDMYYEAVLWALLTPLVARKDTLDFSFAKSRMWPKMQQDPMGRQVPVMDASGNPMIEQLPWNKAELVNSFRLIFNCSSSWIYDFDFVGDTSNKRLGWMRQNFLKNEPGYFPENVDKVQRGVWAYTPIMAMENALKQLTFGSYRFHRNYNLSSNSLKDGVNYANFFIKPSPNYPVGREICIANGYLLYDGDSRTYKEYPNLWHPYSLTTYERVPGRTWGTTYAEKITDINRAYEVGRSEMDRQIRAFGKPKLAMAQGSQIERDTTLGEEQVLRYNAMAADGGKPFYLNPPNSSSSIVDDVRMSGDDFTFVSGITEIMMGINPSGVNTWRGLETLKEEANNAQNNLIRMHESFIARSQFIKLENLRKCLVYPDKNLVNALKVFKKMSAGVTDIDVVDFIGDNLGGHVFVEPFSSMGKSRLAQQEKYMQVAQMGILGDIANDPDLNNEFKKKMDILGFDRKQNKQVQFARHENQLMMQAEKMGQVINPPVQPWHDPILHMQEIDLLLLDPTLQDKQLIIQSLLAHKQMHEQQLNQLKAQQENEQLRQRSLGLQPQQENNQKPKQQQPMQNKPQMPENENQGQQ